MSSHTVSWRKPLGLAAAVSAAGVITLGAATPAVAQDSTFPVVDGTADWGVKESFRTYVPGPIGGGQISVHDGAQLNDDGTYRFVAGTGEYDPATHNVTVAYEGGVQFQAHQSGDHFELDLTISEVRVATDNAAQTGTLTADVLSRDLDSGEFVEYDDVVFADLDLAGITPEQGEGGAVTLADIPAVLTADGAPAFGGFYSAGAVLDPVTISLTADATPPDDGDGDDDDNNDDDGDGADDTDPGAYTVSDGNLDWGFKESFRNYITGPIANGSVTVSGGAVDNGDTYRFVGGSGDLDTEAQTLDVAFDGAVNFTGHDGELDLTVDGVSVQVDGGDAVLYLDDMPFADLELPADGLVVSDDVLSLTALPATLTAEGTAVFEYNGQPMYSEGEQLDPVTINLAVGDDATLPGPGGVGGGTGGKLPVTGTSLTWLPGSLAIGAFMLLAGTAAVWLTRRRTVVAD